MLHKLVIYQLNLIFIFQPYLKKIDHEDNTFNEIKKMKLLLNLYRHEKIFKNVKSLKFIKYELL